MRDHGGVLEISVDKQVIESDNLSNYPNIEPGAYSKLTVSDTGHGIGEEIKERIFDPFFTTKERDHGTGMGLAVVHGIIQGYDGFITLESESGKGAVFHVYIPLLDDTVEYDESMESVTVSYPKGEGRVLLVDDEETLVAMEQRMLEYLGYEVVTKSGSLEALEAFNATPAQFDLVITDLTMPNMTGLELATKMRAVRDDIPIILCTGFSESLTEEKIKNSGIKGLLMKPLSINDLANACRTALESESA